MGFNLGKSLKKIGKQFTKDPLGGIGGLTINAALKGLGMKPINFTQAALPAAIGFLVGGPVGAAAGFGIGLSQQGTFGKSLQDISTMGASAQVRYNQQMYNAYNKAQQQQAKIAELNNQQNLLQQIRAARIARSMNLASYAGENGVTSSGALGNLGSVGSQYLSGATYSVLTGNYANAYQTYMNQYNWYQTQAKNSEIRWNNRKNMINMGLSIYGMQNNLATGQLKNYYAGLKNADAWTAASKTQTEVKQVPNYTGEYFSFVR